MTKIRKLNKSNKQFNKLIKKTLLKYYSEVTPEMLNQFKDLVMREVSELKDTKDNEDYNFEVVSGLIDRCSQVFSYYGQKKVPEGDMMKFIAHNKMYWAKSTEINSFEDSKTNPYYFQYPFSDSVVSELRGRFILQTEKTDNFRDLFARLELAILKYMDSEEWAVLKKAVTDAEPRIRKEKIKFMFPMQGYDQGELVKITDEEALKLGIKRYSIENMSEKLKTEEFDYDLRADNHDMLALKELVLVLEDKKEFSSISIGPGFFGKYMPEVVENGYDGIIFKVKDNKLEKIKLSAFIGRSVSTNKMYFSPLKSSILLAQEYAVKKDVMVFSPTSTKTMFVDINENFIKDNELYFVVVDGMVSAPTLDNWPIMGKSSLNTVGVQAGEVFLYEKRKNGLMSTRLYFTPYKPSQMHVFHQHGSVVFGHNDQSLHSCSDRPNTGSMTMLEEDDYKTFWARTVSNKEKKKEPYSPAMTAALIHHQLDEEDKQASKFLQSANDKILKDIAYSFYEMSYFTLHNEINMLIYKAAPYVKEDFHKLLYKLNENYSPLTKRFLLSSYMKGQFITEEIQPTWYDSLASGREQGLLLKAMGEHAKLQMILEFMDEGLSIDEATAKYQLETQKDKEAGEKE